MHNVIPLILAALIVVGVIAIGRFYFVSPERIVGAASGRCCCQVWHTVTQCQ